jgi:hypothetical protein
MFLEDRQAEKQFLRVQNASALHLSAAKRRDNSPSSPPLLPLVEFPGCAILSLRLRSGKSRGAIEKPRRFPRTATALIQSRAGVERCAGGWLMASEWDAGMNGGFLEVENVARISIGEAHLRNWRCRKRRARVKAFPRAVIFFSLYISFSFLLFSSLPTSYTCYIPIPPALAGRF